MNYEDNWHIYVFVNNYLQIIICWFITQNCLYCRTQALRFFDSDCDSVSVWTQWRSASREANPRSSSARSRVPKQRWAWVRLRCSSRRWCSTARAVCTRCLSSRPGWLTWVRGLEPAFWMFLWWGRKTEKERPKFWTYFSLLRYYCLFVLQSVDHFWLQEQFT